MAEFPGSWPESALRESRSEDRPNGEQSEERSGSIHAAESPASRPGLDEELELLESRVAEAASMLLRLREEQAALAEAHARLQREADDLRGECESLRAAQDAWRREREETATRLAQIIAKVDALRGEP